MAARRCVARGAGRAPTRQRAPADRRRDGRPTSGRADRGRVPAAAHLEIRRRRCRPVINATGVVIHTNLGRAPLATAATDRGGPITAGYSNLEYDPRGGAPRRA